MRSHLKIKNTLKSLPFFSKKQKILKKEVKNLLMQKYYLNYHFSLKKFYKIKNLTSYQLLKELPFFPKRPKKLKKYAILKNILPYYFKIKKSP